MEPTPPIPPKKWIVIAMLIFFTLLCIGLVLLIYNGWPHSDKWFYKKLSNEQQLILLVALCGGLGSFVHMVTSFTDYLGSKMLDKSWMAWYLMRPFVGATLALSFYFLIRGGLVTVGSAESSPSGMQFYNQDTITYIHYDTASRAVIRSSADSLAGMRKIGVERKTPRGDNLPINPFGIAAISILAGMFSRQAVDKLRELFENLFLTKEKVARANALAKDSNDVSAASKDKTTEDDQAVG